MKKSIKEYIRNLIFVFRQRGGFHDEENSLLKKYYNASAKSVKHQIVFMVDGRSVHGGLADRLKGICTLYEYAKSHNIPFRIYFKYPFLLQKYLEPNKYDWIISDEELDYNKNGCKCILLNTHQLPREFHKLYLDIVCKKYTQLHVYSNSDIYIDKFYENFHELFKPSERVRHDLEKNLNAIGAKFVSITYRFQQLLGDFKERNYKTLDETSKDELIIKSLKLIEEVHEKHPDKRILITSDSISFLERADKYEYVYIIPGVVVHMDYTSDADYIAYEKSFIDLLMLSHAEKIYLAYTGLMYRSGFAYCASLIGNVEYEEIKY